MEKKIYTKKSEKVLDFFIGFVGVPTFFAAISWGSMGVFSFLKHKQFIFSDKNAITIIFLVLIGFTFYVVRRRKYVAVGLIFFLVIVPLVIAGTCFALILGISGSH